MGRQADTISATVNYTANTVSTGNLSAEANDEGQITFEVALPKSAKEAVVFTVITLTNRVGSTQSEPAEKSKCLTFQLIALAANYIITLLN